MAHMSHNWFFEKCDNKVYGSNFLLLLTLKPKMLINTAGFHNDGHHKNHVFIWQGAFQNRQLVAVISNSSLMPLVLQ